MKWNLKTLDMNEFYQCITQKPPQLATCNMTYYFIRTIFFKKYHFEVLFYGMYAAQIPNQDR